VLWDVPEEVGGDAQLIGKCVKAVMDGKPPAEWPLGMPTIVVRPTFRQDALAMVAFVELAGSAKRTAFMKDFLRKSRGVRQTSRKRHTKLHVLQKFELAFTDEQQWLTEDGALNEAAIDKVWVREKEHLALRAWARSCVDLPALSHHVACRARAVRAELGSPFVYTPLLPNLPDSKGLNVDFLHCQLRVGTRVLVYTLSTVASDYLEIKADHVLGFCLVHHLPVLAKAVFEHVKDPKTHKMLGSAVTATGGATRDEVAVLDQDDGLLSWLPKAFAKRGGIEEQDVPEGRREAMAAFLAFYFVYKRQVRIQMRDAQRVPRHKCLSPLVQQWIADALSMFHILCFLKVRRLLALSYVAKLLVTLALQLVVNIYYHGGRGALDAHGEWMEAAVKFAAMANSNGQGAMQERLLTRMHAWLVHMYEFCNVRDSRSSYSSERAWTRCPSWRARSAPGRRTGRRRCPTR